MDVSTIRRVIEKLEREGKASATIIGYLVAIGSFLSWAKRERLIRHNPMSELDSSDRPSKNPVRVKRFLSEAQVEALLAEMADVFRPVAATLAYSGLRVSEALGLRWQDVDFDAGKINVESQLGPTGTLVPLKTNESEAEAPLLPALARELRAHRERVGRWIGFSALQPDHLIFSTPSGRSPGRHNVKRAVTVESSNASLGHVTPHDLRRTFLSLAVDRTRRYQRLGKRRSGEVTIKA